MKKFFALICLVLCVVLMFALVSCKKELAGNPDEDVKQTEKETQPEETKGEEKPAEPTSAKELWALVDNTMENLDSYESDLSMDMVMYMNGYKFESKGSGYEIKIGDKENADYYYYRFLNSEITCDELSFSQIQKNIEAYNEGMAFISNVNGEYIQSLCSKMTGEEFEAFTDSALSDEFDYEDCTKAEFLKNEDGTWTLAFSGYTKKMIGIFLEGAKIEDGELGADVIDMKLSFVADSQYRVNELIMELVFDVEETDTAVPVCKQIMKYSKFGEAKKTTEGINVSEYTEVENIDILSKVEKGIEDFCNLPEGSFTLDMKQELKDSLNTSVITEKDSVTFGKKNGSYVYNMDVIYNGEAIKIEYKNGIQSVTVGEESESYAQTEAEAKEYILELVNSAAYDSSLVTNIETISEGVYKLSVATPESGVYEEFLGAYGITFKSATQEIIVTFTNNELSKIESEVKIIAEFTENGQTEGVDMNVLTGVTFNIGSSSSQNM